MDFSEFVKYCTEHEQKLWLVFNDLDVNKDGEFIIIIYPIASGPHHWKILVIHMIYVQWNLSNLYTLKQWHLANQDT